MEHRDDYEDLRVVDYEQLDFDDFIPEDLACLIEIELPYKTVIPVKENGDIIFYSGRVRMYIEKDGAVRRFIVDKLEKL